MAQITTSVQIACDFLKKGNVVAIPTETVYGLAGNALDEKTIAEIFSIKNRPSFDPLIVHLPDANAVEKYAVVTNETQLRLMQRVWPGPLTILFKKKTIIPDIVTSGSEWVGLRVPAHSLTLKLLSMLDFPLAAPSANPFGYISPTTAEHVEKQLGHLIPCILDGGPCNVGLESTVVRAEEHQIVILRPGGISPEELKKISEVPVVLQPHSTSRPDAPGLFTRHYAPHIPAYFLPRQEWKKFFDKQNVICIYFGKKETEWPERWICLALSENGNLMEAAQKLFTILRKADESDADLILTEPLPALGLGIAINDRLRRAAASSVAS